MSLDAVAVSPLSNSELDCIGLAVTTASLMRLLLSVYGFFWYRVSEEPEAL